MRWLLPAERGCVREREELLVSADGPRKIEAVRFLDGDRLIGVDQQGDEGELFSTMR